MKLSFLFVVFFAQLYMTAKNLVGGMEIQLKEGGGGKGSKIAKSLGSQQCTMGCTVQLAFGDPLVWPADCSQLEARTYCFVTIQWIYSQKKLVIDFNVERPIPDAVWDADGLSEYLVNQSQYTISPYPYDPQHEVGWLCSTGAEPCDKKWVEANLDSVINSINEQAALRKLSDLLYTSPPQVKQCYTSATDLVDCPVGRCAYGIDDNGLRLQSIPVPDLKPSCNLDSSTTEVVTVLSVSGRAFSGSAQDNIEYAIFTCNKDKCNGPTTIAAVGRIFDGTDSGDSGGSSVHSAAIRLFTVFFVAVTTLFSFSDF